MIEIELIVGTMGLDMILADRLPKYSAALLKRASSVLKDFKEGANVFADSDEPEGLPDAVIPYEDYDKLTKKMLDDQDYVEMTEGLESWPSELQMEIMVQIADVKAYLMDQMPRNEMVGAISSTQIEPSDSDKFRFLWQAELVNDIRGFVGLLNSGAITPIESALMRTLFPQTHDYLIVEVMDKTMDALLDGKADEWEGSWRKTALSGLLGVPVTSFQDVMTWQTGMEDKTAGRPKGPGSVQVASMNLTDNQKIDTKTLDLK